MINLPLVRPKGHHTDRIWNITRKLVWDIAERWGLTKIATYHVMAEVASHFDSAEEFAALAGRRDKLTTLLSAVLTEQRHGNPDKLISDTLERDIEKALAEALGQEQEAE